MKLKLIFTLILGIGVYALFIPRSSLKDRITFSVKESEEVFLPTEIDTLLDQPFAFLAKGTQAYVFASLDGKYVLKFLKYHPSPRFFPNREKILKHQKEHEDAVQACTLAWEAFREETALIYTHLHPSQKIDKTLVLYDKKGRRRTISLDQTCFYIQKRAQLIYPHIDELMAQGDLLGAMDAVHSIVSLLEEFGKRGVVENDPVLRRNFGFIGNTPVQIDCCSMKIDLNRINTTDYLDEMNTTLKPLRAWLESNYPELNLSL